MMDEVMQAWLDGVQERNARAWAEIAGLCDGSRKWTMRVPVDESRDSDEVIAAALKDGERAVDAIRRVLGLIGRFGAARTATDELWILAVTRALHGADHGAVTT